MFLGKMNKNVASQLNLEREMERYASHLEDVNAIKLLTVQVMKENMGNWLRCHQQNTFFALLKKKKL